MDIHIGMFFSAFHSLWELQLYTHNLRELNGFIMDVKRFRWECKRIGSSSGSGQPLEMTNEYFMMISVESPIRWLRCTMHTGLWGPFDFCTSLCVTVVHRIRPNTITFLDTYNFDILIFVSCFCSTRHLFTFNQRQLCRISCMRCSHSSRNSTETNRKKNRSSNGIGLSAPNTTNTLACQLEAYLRQIRQQLKIYSSQTTCTHTALWHIEWCSTLMQTM